jgi:hypothetical protein
MHLLTSKLWSMAQNRVFDWWSKIIAGGESSLATRRRVAILKTGRPLAALFC